MSIRYGVTTALILSGCVMPSSSTFTRVYDHGDQPAAVTISYSEVHGQMSDEQRLRIKERAKKVITESVNYLAADMNSFGSTSSLNTRSIRWDGDTLYYDARYRGGGPNNPVYTRANEAINFSHAVVTRVQKPSVLGAWNWQVYFTHRGEQYSYPAPDEQSAQALIDAMEVMGARISGR